MTTNHFFGEYLSQILENIHYVPNIFSLIQFSDETNILGFFIGFKKPLRKSNEKYRRKFYVGELSKSPGAQISKDLRKFVLLSRSKLINYAFSYIVRKKSLIFDRERDLYQIFRLFLTL